MSAIAETGRRLRGGDVTPRELAEEALARLETRGRALNAVTALLADRGFAEADLAARELAAGVDRGPLHGIPYAAKDLLAAAGAPTTWGAAPFRDQAFTVDGEVIRRLREAGAVLVGKLAMVELAGGFDYDSGDAAWTGPARNAWDPERWAGGSSSGSGAAVAAGCVPFAIGSETWGSIASPAGLNGISGFRPTYGLVSRRGAMALSWTMDKIGPMARTAEECETILAAIAGPDAGDPTTHHAPAHQADPRRSGFRFAVARPALEGTGFDPEVAARFEEALQALASIGTVETVDLPAYPAGDMATVIIEVEAAAAFEEFIAGGGPLALQDPSDRHGLVHALEIPAVDYLRAMRLRRLLARDMATLLDGFDAIVAPGQPRIAPPLSVPLSAHYDAEPTAEGARLGAIGNLCGLPSAFVPMGPGAHGMPTSLEFMSAAGRDGVALAAAIAYQRVTDWHRLTPPGA